MQWLLLVLAFGAGVLNTVQSGSNAALQKSLQQPVIGGLVVYAVGALTMLAVSPFLGLSFRGLGARVLDTPWWAWLGGLLGAAYVLAMLLIADRLGAALFTAVTLTAAVITSVVLDHYGLVGFAVRPATLWRIVGCALMIGGVSLVARF